MTDAYGLHALPAGIPPPVDDGACDHLSGMRLPPVALSPTSDEPLDLSSLPGTTVVYSYPRTGRPGENLPQGWDETPGARGCKPRSCAFRDQHAEPQTLEARLFGLSTQGTGYQREAVERLRLPVDNVRIEKVFYPVFPPGENVEEVVAWLSRTAHEGARR